MLSGHKNIPRETSSIFVHLCKFLCWLATRIGESISTDFFLLTDAGDLLMGAVNVAYNLVSFYLNNIASFFE